MSKLGNQGGYGELRNEFGLFQVITGRWTKIDRMVRLLKVTEF